MSDTEPTERRVLWGVGLGAGLISVGVNLHGIDLLDEGTILHIAERLADGEVLYRDVVTGIMPGGYYLLALAFLVAGKHLLVARFLMSIVLTTAVLLVFSICRRFSPRGWAAATALGFTLWQAHAWRYAHYSGGAVTLVLAGLLVYINHLRRPGPKRLVSAALLFGAAFVFKQNYGGLAILAFVACEVVRTVGEAVRGEATGGLRRWAVTAAGLCLPVFGCAVLFSLAGALGDFLNYTLVVPLTMTTDYYSLPFPSLFGSVADDPDLFRGLASYSPFYSLHGWLVERGVLGYEGVFTVVRLYYYLPIAALLLAAVATATRLFRAVKGNGALPMERVALVSIPAALFLGVFPRCDLHHFLLAAGPVVLVAAVYTAELVASRGWLRRAAGSISALVLLLILAIAALGVAGFVWSPDPAERKTATFRGDRAFARVAPSVRDGMQAAVADLERLTGGRPFLAAPTPSLFYFLAKARNPTRFPLILPGATDEAEIVRDLEEQEVEYLVYSDASIDGRTVLQDLPILARHVRDRYCVHPDLPILYAKARTALLVPKARCPQAVEPVEIGFGDRQGEALVTRWQTVAWLLEYLDGADRRIVQPQGQVWPLAHSAQMSRSAWLLEEALFQAPSSGLNRVVTTFGIELPAGAALEVALGMAPEVWSDNTGDGVVFEIFAAPRRGVGRGAERGDGFRLLLREYVDPKNRAEDRRWRRFRIDLSGFGGETIDLSFATWGGPRLNLRGGMPARGYDYAGWGDPRIVVPLGMDSAAFEGGIVSGGQLSSTAGQSVALGDYEEVFLAELSALPDDLDVRFALGQFHWLRRRAEQAAPHLLAAFDGGFRSRSTVEPLLMALIRLRDDTTLERVLATALEDDPANPMLRLRRADLLRRRGEFEAAAGAYLQLVEEGSVVQGVRSGLAQALLGAGRVDEAVSQVELLLTRDAEEAPRLYELGWALRRAERLALASRCFQAAVERSEGPPTGFSTAWASALTALERPEDALEVIERALDRHPTAPALLRSAVVTLWSLDRLDEACRYAKIADRSGGEETEVLFYSARCAMREGEPEAALQRISQVERSAGPALRPQHLRLKIELLVALGRRDEAGEANALGRELFPEEPYFETRARWLATTEAGSGDGRGGGDWRDDDGA